jgi:hypothetical protein
MLTPLTVKTLSNDWAPEIVMFPAGPFEFTPGDRRTEFWMVLAVGSLSMRFSE